MNSTHKQISDELITFHYFFNYMPTIENSNVFSPSNFSKLTASMDFPPIDIKTFNTNISKLIKKCQLPKDASYFSSYTEYVFYLRITNLLPLQQCGNFEKREILVSYYPLVIGLISALNKGSKNNWKKLKSEVLHIANIMIQQLSSERLLSQDINKDILLYTYLKILDLYFPDELCTFYRATENNLRSEPNLLKRITYHELNFTLTDAFFKTTTMQKQFYSQISVFADNPFHSSCPAEQAPLNYIKDIYYKLFKEENSIHAEIFSKYEVLSPFVIESKINKYMISYEKKDILAPYI